MRKRKPKPFKIATKFYMGASQEAFFHNSAWWWASQAWENRAKDAEYMYVYHDGDLVGVFHLMKVYDAWLRQVGQSRYFFTEQEPWNCFILDFQSECRRMWGL